MRQSKRCFGLARVISSVIDCLSGEWMLLWLAPRNNAGWMILFRSLLVTFEVVLIILATRHAVTAVDNLNSRFLFNFEPLPVTWAKRLAIVVAEARAIKHGYGTELLGVFGGTYAALYTRFSSQWQYLADLYNQIKAQEISFAIACMEGSLKAAATNDINDSVGKVPQPSLSLQPDQLLAEWKKGFIEDAFALHLAKKPIFCSVVANWARQPDVKKLIKSERTRDDVKQGVMEIVEENVAKRAPQHP